MAAFTETGEKARADEAVKRSVALPADSAQQIMPDIHVAYILGFAETVIPWGSAIQIRDAQLRNFIPSESYFLSALGTVCARNAGFSWTLEGGEKTVETMQDMLLNSDWGDGWESFIVKLSIDLYTQDKGSFVELVRAGESPNAPCINVRHLDAQRCYPTGNPEEPVIYMDRNGRNHKLKWFQVYQFLEMPSPVETPMGGPLFNMQYCALTRVLRAAETIKNIMVMNAEMTGGRWNKEIHLIRGISVDKIQAKLLMHDEDADAKGLKRFMSSPMVGSADLEAEVGHDTIPLARLPDNFDIDKFIKNYITVLALGFNGDYQDFAPLPGGNLGTSAQSEILHQKSRGKGPAHFMKMIAHFMNFAGVLPRGCTFKWDEQDTSADQEIATLKSTRGTDRAARIVSQELDVQAARQEALDDGDMSQEIFDDLAKREDEKQQKAQDAQAQQLKIAQANAAAAGQQPPDPNAPPAKNGNGPVSDITPGITAADSVPAQRGARGDITVTDAIRKKERTPPERLEAEAEVADEFADIIGSASAHLVERLRESRLISDDVATKQRGGGIRRTVTRWTRAGRAAEVEERPL